MFNGQIIAGIPVSLTGQFKVQGRQALQGLEAWSNWINQKGGIWVAGLGLKIPVAIRYYDDCSLPPKTREITRQLLLEDRVDLLFGPYASSLSLASAEVVDSHGGLMWNQGGASDEIHEKKYSRVVSILSPASTYLLGLPHLVKELRPEAPRLALAHASSGVFSKMVSDGMEREAFRLGFETVMKLEFSVETRDFTPVINEVDQTRPDLLLGVGRIYNDLLFAKQISQRNLDVGAIAFVATPIQQFRNALGPNREGMLGPSQWEFLGSDLWSGYGPTSREVVTLLGCEGDEVDYPAVQSFAAGLIAQRSVEDAGNLTPESLWHAAVRLDFSTFYGRFKIDAITGRQIGHKPVIVQWQNGEKVVVWADDIKQNTFLFPWSSYRINL